MLSSQRRGGIASIALGLNVAMMLLAAIGLYGAIRLQVVVLLVHASLVIALILVFVLSFLATVLFGSGGAGSSDAGRDHNREALHPKQEDVRQRCQSLRRAGAILRSHASDPGD